VTNFSKVIDLAHVLSIDPGNNINEILPNEG